MPDLLTDARKVLKWIDRTKRYGVSEYDDALSAASRLVAALEKAEPVAWIWLEGTELLNGTEVEQFERVELSREKPSDDVYGLTPLYAHPPLGVSVPEGYVPVPREAVERIMNSLRCIPNKPITPERTISLVRELDRAMLSATPK